MDTLKNCLANDFNGIPFKTSVLLSIKVGGQGKHSYIFTVLGVIQFATLTVMIPMKASVVGYIGASTFTEVLDRSGEIIT